MTSDAANTMMKIFGYFTVADLTVPVESIFALQQSPAPPQFVYGAYVANAQLLKYIVKYANFDQYHFYFPAPYLCLHPSLESDMRDIFQDHQRVKIQRIDDYQRNLARAPCRVFHRSQGPCMADWVAFRNRGDNRAIPVSSTTYSMSYLETLEELAALIMAGARPWDSIVCTGASARTVTQRLLEHVEGRMESQMGCSLRYGGRLDSIPLGVDSEVYCPREKSAIRRQLDLPAEGLLLLWFGRFSPYDKADLRPLLIAFKLALDRLAGKPITLLLAGEDIKHGYAGQVEAWAAELKIRDRVILRPNPSVAVGPLYYSASDLFICPSDNLQETFGLSVIEAMSSGLPVICSDWDGFRDTVVHEQTGLRIPTYWGECDSDLCAAAALSPWRYNHLYLSQGTCVDVPLMAEAIELLANSGERRREMGQCARERVLRNYDWKEVIRQYVALWDELHEVASHDGSTGGRSAWFSPAYNRTFQSYPSFVLNSATAVRANSTLPWLPDFRECLRGYRELGEAFRPEVAELILQRAQHGARLGDLEQIGVGAARHSAEMVRWHVLRLLKYHYLTLDSAVKPRLVPDT